MFRWTHARTNKCCKLWEQLNSAGPTWPVGDLVRAQLLHAHKTTILRQLTIGLTSVPYLFTAVGMPGGRAGRQGRRVGALQR